MNLKRQAIQFGLVVGFLISGFLISGFFASTFAYAHDKNGKSNHTHKSCSGILHGESEIIPSGRDDDLIPFYQEAAKVIFGKDGTLQKLGINLPPQYIEFLSSSEMANMTALGRHAVSHWVDGMAFQQTGRGHIYEFVTPGCPTCRSFYDDTTDPIEQLSIMFHVGGHNDFSSTNYYARIRSMDPIVRALELSHELEELYSTVDHDRVSQFYQNLQTLEWMQDFQHGTYQEPSDFSPEKQKELAQKRGDDGRYKSPRFPVQPTSNVLQYMVDNLPQSSETWKHSLIESYERMIRYYPYMAKTKIMNEGWASLMMEIGPGHSPYVSDTHNFQHAQLLKGVAGRASLQNPYWLGREAWRCIRRRFEAQPEIAKLDPLARDKAFIQEAHKLIEQMDDFQFLRYGLDAQWVKEHELYMSRDVMPEEFDPSLPDPDPKLPNQHIILSRDPKRIIDHIAEVAGDVRMMMPDIQVVEENGLGRGVFVLSHNVQFNVPLKLNSAAQALYVISKLKEKPASLSTIADISPPLPEWLRKLPSYMRKRYLKYYLGQLGRSQIVPIRIEVAPSGAVQVYRVEKDADGQSREVLDAELQWKLQEAVKFYQMDEDMSVNSGLVENEDEKFAPLINAIMAQNVMGPATSMSHTPTAAAAMSEYTNMIRRRLLRSMEMARDGLLPVRQTARGVRFRIVPLVPKFELDRKTMNRLAESLPPAPVDGASVAPALISGRIEITANAIQFFAKYEGQPNEVLDQNVSKELTETYQSLQNPEMVRQLKEFTTWIQSFNQWAQNRPAPVARSSDALPEDTPSEIGSGNGKPGGKKWAPSNDDGQGSGDDEGEGDETGTDPGEEAGQGGINPSEVEIPAEVWDEFLNENIDLPKLRPKSGESDIKESVRQGVEHKPHGEIVWTKTAPKAFVMGQIALKKKGDIAAASNPNLALQEGMKYLTPGDYRVRARDQVTIPDMNAVVVMVMDGSGSMSGWPYIKAKNLIRNIRARLQRKYKRVTFVYVMFDTKAYVFEDENKFLRTHLGGGTDYPVGIDEADQVLQKFPPALWDRFAIINGDSGDFAPLDKTMTSLKNLMQNSDYTAYVHYGAPGMPLDRAIDSLSQMDDTVGFAIMSPDPGSEVGVLRKLFGKKEQQ